MAGASTAFAAAFAEAFTRAFAGSLCGRGVRCSQARSAVVQPVVVSR
ncbi:hypothetical protein ABH930_005547 [Kitasatospora sp. GAS204A]|nr:hypothetical protein [Kitasatospora sp. GAS204B]MDH6121550.1 hypothetical protein [Kitasatospora sp. GAS204B]